MTEERVGFLYNIASNLCPNNESIKILRSFYLMRCNELTKGYGLPSQHFSTKIRCPHCCLEWTRDTEVKVRPLKLSKSQTQRIKSQKRTHQNRKKIDKRKSLLCSNEMEQICTFCKSITTTKLMKPAKDYIKVTPEKESSILLTDNQMKPEIKNTQMKQDINETQKSKIKKKAKVIKSEEKKCATVNVYSNAYDVFSLENNKNSLSHTVKEPAKVIKNNKKRKDRFAGLCHKAVLASAKLKLQTEKPQDQKSINKLSLFLKPSVN